MRLKPQTYVLTSVAHQRRRVFQRDVIAELFTETIFRYRDAGKFRLHGFVVMPDHVHVLLTPAPELSIERCAQLIKGGFSFGVRKEFAGEVWQEGYHAHRVIDGDDLQNQMLYIVNNPVRKGLAQYLHIHTATAYRSRIDPMPDVESC
jgi:putative transposase